MDIEVVIFNGDCTVQSSVLTSDWELGPRLSPAGNFFLGLGAPREWRRDWHRELIEKGIASVDHSEVMAGDNTVSSVVLKACLNNEIPCALHIGKQNVDGKISFLDRCVRWEGGAMLLEIEELHNLVRGIKVIKEGNWICPGSLPELKLLAGGFDRAEAKKVFSGIIWNAEINNLTLSEYLDLYPEEDSVWRRTENACEKAGICIWEVQCK